MPRRSHAIALGRTSAASFKAGTDAATTIALRLPILMAAPSAATAAEWQRAWTEKMSAAFSGAVEAGAAFQKLAFKMGTGAIAAEHMAVELIEVAEAATRPGYKAVAANARRLSRGKRSG
jgi:hypothetical protein